MASTGRCRCSSGCGCGAPFTVNLAVDRANVGAGPAQRPDQVTDPNLPGGERTVTRWFDTSAFTQPANFTFGTSGRNIVRAPGMFTMDFSVMRLFKIGDEYKIDIHPDRSGKNLGFVNSFTFPDGKYIKVGFPEEPGGEPPP